MKHTIKVIIFFSATTSFCLIQAQNEGVFFDINNPLKTKKRNLSDARKASRNYLIKVAQKVKKGALPEIAIDDAAKEHALLCEQERLESLYPFCIAQTLYYSKKYRKASYIACSATSILTYKLFEWLFTS